MQASLTGGGRGWGETGEGETKEEGLNLLMCDCTHVMQFEMILHNAHSNAEAGLLSLVVLCIV